MKERKRRVEIRTLPVRYGTFIYPLPGVFHDFSIDYEEFESGPGHYPVAIVELKDGRIVLPYADDIRFLD